MTYTTALRHMALFHPTVRIMWAEMPGVSGGSLRELRGRFGIVLNPELTTVEAADVLGQAIRHLEAVQRTTHLRVYVEQQQLAAQRA